MFARHRQARKLLCHWGNRHLSQRTCRRRCAACQRSVSNTSSCCRAQTRRPYLRDGSVIPVRDATIPQAIGPVLDQASALIDSVPKEKLSDLLDETFGLQRTPDMISDPSSTLRPRYPRTSTARRPSKKLVDDSVPLLDSQVATTDSIRTWARSLAGITSQLVTMIPRYAHCCRRARMRPTRSTRLLNQVKPTLPVLLANLTTIGQVGVTYNPSLRQLLVLLPPVVGAFQSALPGEHPEGMALSDCRITIEPPPCLVGFLPPSQWRSPGDTDHGRHPRRSVLQAAAGLAIVVRGARNVPCMGQPGKRAPTVEICNSDRPYEPLAMRQHTLGPYPFDPNLVSQGVPLDERVTANENLLHRVEGTPPPPGAAIPPGPPGAPAPIHRGRLGRLCPAPPPPAAIPPGAVPAAPSAFDANASEPAHRWRSRITTHRPDSSNTRWHQPLNRRTWSIRRSRGRTWSSRKAP